MPSPQKEEAGRPWVLVRHRECWADEFDCSGLAVMPADDWSAQLARLRAECPPGDVEATAGGDVEVDSAYSGVGSYLASCFSVLDFPADAACELARLIGTGRMHGTVMRPRATPWFLPTSRPFVPGRSPKDDGWCVVLFADSWRGMPLRWLGLMPTRSWRAGLARIRAGLDEDGNDSFGLGGEVDASFGSNESIAYDDVEDWLARFTVFPASDCLARALMLALASDRPGRGARPWVRTASNGLLPRPIGLWRAFESDAPTVPTPVCYHHGAPVDVCRLCAPGGGDDDDDVVTPRLGCWAPELLALGADVCTRRFTVTAWTDMPFPVLGDAPDVPAPERECTVLSCDRDAHAVVSIDAPRMGTVTLSVATSCLYTIRGRRGDVPCLPAGTLAELPREPLRVWRRPVL